jgi:protein farnesyltransferase subunit beta
VPDYQIFDEEDRVKPIDPVYAIPQEKRNDIMAYFAAKPGF